MASYRCGRVERDTLMRIGEVMRQHYKLPGEMPDRLITLLEQLTSREENNPCRLADLACAKNSNPEGPLGDQKKAGESRITGIQEANGTVGND
jgi:hypothetical protein